MEVKRDMSKSSFGWARLLFVLVAILYIICGIMMLNNPVEGMAAMGIFTGSLLIAYGAMLVISYFMSTYFKSVWALILGILMIALGFVVCTNLVTSVNVMGVLFGIGFLCAGVFRAYQSFQLKDMGLSTWWLVLILGILDAVVGCIMAFHVGMSGYYLSVYVGATFLVNGISDLITALLAY